MSQLSARQIAPQLTALACNQLTLILTNVDGTRMLPALEASCCTLVLLFFYPRHLVCCGVPPAPIPPPLSRLYPSLLSRPTHLLSSSFASPCRPLPLFVSSPTSSGWSCGVCTPLSCVAGPPIPPAPFPCFLHPLLFLPSSALSAIRETCKAMVDPL